MNDHVFPKSGDIRLWRKDVCKNVCIILKLFKLNVIDKTLLAGLS